MCDVLPPCLTARGYAQGGHAGRWLWRSRDAMIRDAVEAMKQRLGSKCISKRWGLFLRLRLYRVGGAQPLLATDEERVAANVNWE